MALSVITGANRGIGLALCKAIKKTDATVIAACRTSSEELDKLGVEVVTGVDVGNKEGASRLKAAIGERPIELLINNAGILIWGDELGQIDFEGVLRQFEVNALGPVRITAALLPNLIPGAKLAYITSRMGSIADNGSGGHYGYRMSKAALNSAAVSFAKDFEKKQISVAILHPGMVSTEMIGGRGQIEPDEAAAGLLKRIDELNMKNSGSFWHQNGQVLPW